MKPPVLAIIALLVATAPVAQCAQPIATAQLYCTGKSSLSARERDESAADAFVRITDKGVYMDISSLGSGLSTSLPKMISGLEAGGSLVLHPEKSGQSQLDVLYSLNKYSGELSVTTTSATEGRRVLFAGNCKRAEPLF